MSKGYRDGAFALGLVVGGGLVVNLFLWLDDRTRHAVHSNSPENQNRQDSSETALWWSRWTGDYVSSSDTLAQWIMALFTIVATVVLLFTLRSANKTNLAAVKAASAAIDANKIMREIADSQLRAYVQFDRAEVVGENWIGGDPCVLAMSFKNTGQTPALNVKVSYFYLEAAWDQINEMLEADPIWDPQIMRGGRSTFYCGIIGSADIFTFEHSHADGFSSDWLKVFQDPSKTYLVAGVICYRDVTMSDHYNVIERRTRFCFSIPNPDSDDGGKAKTLRNEFER